MKKHLLSLMITGFLFAVASGSFSQPMGPGDRRDGDMSPGRGPMGHGGGMHHEGRPHKGLFFGDPQVMKEKFGLSDEQVEKIGIINNDFRKKLLTIRDSIEPKRTKLQSLLTGDNINLNDVRALLEEISKFEVEIRMLRINHILEIEKVLTPAQKKELRNSMKQMMGKLYRRNDILYRDREPIAD
ncbi:MAG: Spy/CpxP family protein refolding chaperone [Spirochaetota bacterium]